MMKIWKARRLLGLGVCCFLLAALLVTGALAQSIGPYQVEGGMISGEGYRLTTANWQVSGAASGGGYRLLATEGRAAPELRGSGCCCTYLPCVLRQSP
jgi:hypothetical protein